MKIFTYDNQPYDNVDCWRLGEACLEAAGASDSGDLIDRGLVLLRELQAKGFGVVKIDRQQTVSSIKEARKKANKNK